jgi:hypothetical protein
VESPSSVGLGDSGQPEQQLQQQEEAQQQAEAQQQPENQTPSQEEQRARDETETQQAEAGKESDKKKSSADDDGSVNAALGLINTGPIQLKNDLEEPVTSGGIGIDLFGGSPGTSN